MCDEVVVVVVVVAKRRIYDDSRRGVLRKLGEDLHTAQMCVGQPCPIVGATLAYRTT